MKRFIWIGKGVIYILFKVRPRNIIGNSMPVYGVLQVVEKEEGIFFLIFDHELQVFRYINSYECVPLNSCSSPPQIVQPPQPIEPPTMSEETQNKIKAYTNAYSEWLNGDPKEESK